MLRVTTHSVKETEQFAQKLAQKLKPNDIIAFTGGLGVGKTAFVRGLANGLGCSDEVSSPTFSLVHEYEGPIVLYHFDMYRVHTMDELYSTGFYDYLGCGGILAIEWSENIASALKWESCIFVSIEQDGENTRTITVNGGDRF